MGIFPKTTALLSVLYLSLGDPMASLCGILYQRRVVEGCDPSVDSAVDKNRSKNHKSLASVSSMSSGGKTYFGSLGAGVTCFLITFGFLYGCCVTCSNVSYLPSLSSLCVTDDHDVIHTDTHVYDSSSINSISSSDARQAESIKSLVEGWVVEHGHALPYLTVSQMTLVSLYGGLV